MGFVVKKAENERGIAMSVRELNRDQLVQLKQNYLCEIQHSVSWGELACADSLISDETIFAEYAGYFFVEEDFA